MLDLLDPHCWPYIETGADVAPDLAPASAGATQNLLDGAAGRAWVAESPALALFDYDGATSCGVFGLDIAAQEFVTATAGFAETAGMTQGASTNGRAEYLKARDDGDVTMLIAMAIPGADVAAINAMRLPSGDWSNTVLGEN